MLIVVVYYTTLNLPPEKVSDVYGLYVYAAIGDLNFTCAFENSYLDLRVESGMCMTGYRN